MREDDRWLGKELVAEPVGGSRRVKGAESHEFVPFYAYTYRKGKSRMGNLGASATSTLLHDAVVDQFKFDAARGRLEVIIWKSQENKTVLCWQLLISGAINKKDIQQAQFAIDIILAKAKRNSLGFRIDEFSCEKQPASQHENSCIVNLSIDHLVPLRVECAKCTLQILDSQLFTSK